jgi:hypothetical protein
LQLEAPLSSPTATCSICAKTRSEWRTSPAAKAAFSGIHQVELTTPTGVKRELFFDGRLSSSEKKNPAPLTAPVRNFPTMTTTRQRHPGRAQAATSPRRRHLLRLFINRASVNGVIGERVFDFPRKSQIQLPDLKQLLPKLTPTRRPSTS